MTIAEIEPLVPAWRRSTSAPHNFDVYKNPKTRLVLDDARHFLLTTNEKFDAITSDPLDPWVKGAAALYTREFFDEVKQHLNPGGVMTLFVQLYESNPAAVKSEIATFLEAFPERRGLGQHAERRRLRPGAAGDGRAAEDRRRRIEQTLKSPRVRAGGAIALGDRHVLGGRSVLDLCRPAAGSRSVDERRDHQSRPQPAAAVPGRASASTSIRAT